MADDLHADVARINTRLDHIVAAIDELKELAVPLKELGNAVVRIEEQYKAIQRDVSIMMSFRDTTADFVARAKGGLAVALFVFTIIQTLFGLAWAGVTRAQTDIETRVRTLENKR